MHILSVNVGRPRTAQWGGREVRTAIFKAPVAGPVALGQLNLAGDAQADLRVHGGPDKAVYAYAREHYDFWAGELPPGVLTTAGAFGENLTTAGLLETEVRIGDLFGVGTAVLRAVQPRLPCYKINLRFDDADMVRRFARAGRPGIYFRVERAGTVQANDSITLLETAETAVTVQHVNDLLLGRAAVAAEIRAAALASPHLPAGLRQQLSG